MFKYFYHRNRSWPKNGAVWNDINPEKYQTKVIDFESALKFLQEEEFWVYDCDGGNEEEYFVGVSYGKVKKYFKVLHDFYAHYSTGEDFTVHNQFEVFEITKEEAHIPDDRDWLDISEWNYKLKGWPRNA